MLSDSDYSNKFKVDERFVQKEFNAQLKSFSLKNYDPNIKTVCSLFLLMDMVRKISQSVNLITK